MAIILRLNPVGIYDFEIFKFNFFLNYKNFSYSLTLINFGKFSNIIEGS